LTTLKNAEKKLTCYLWHGEIVIDNNLVENAIRALAVGRKNYLFIGSQKGKDAAIFYSLIDSCKMAGINSLEWLTDVIKNTNEAHQATEKRSLSSMKLIAPTFAK